MPLHLWVQEHLSQRVTVDVRGQSQVSPFSSSFSKAVWLVCCFVLRLNTLACDLAVLPSSPPIFSQGHWGNWCKLLQPTFTWRLGHSPPSVTIAPQTLQQLGHLLNHELWTFTLLKEVYTFFSLIIFFLAKLLSVCGNFWDAHSLSGLRTRASWMTVAMCSCVAVYVVSCRRYYFSIPLD